MAKQQQSNQGHRNHPDRNQHCCQLEQGDSTGGGRRYLDQGGGLLTADGQVGQTNSERNSNQPDQAQKDIGEKTDLPGRVAGQSQKTAPA